MSFTRQLSDINHEHDILMKHNFDLRKFFTFHYYSQNYQGILFRGSLVQSTPIGTLAKTGVASCTFYYENDFIKLTNKLKTTGDVKVGLNFNLNKYIKNLESKFKIRTNYNLDEFDGKVRFLLTKNKYNIKSTLDWSLNKCLTVSILGILLSRPQEELGFGSGLSLAFEEKQFSLYKMCLWYAKNNAKIVLGHKTAKNKFQAGRLTARVYNRIDDKTDLVLSAMHDFQEQEDRINMGVRYRYSDTLTSKVKFDSNLNAASVLEIKVNKNVQLVVAARTNLGKEKRISSLHANHNTLPFALKLTLGEN